MNVELFTAFILITAVLIIVPGPIVTLVISTGATQGMRAALTTVAGTTLGNALLLTAIAFGLNWVLANAVILFEILRWGGAAYLIWLGWKLLTAPGEGEAGGAPRRPRGGFFMQGLAVALSNPKTLLFFGAFFPQFIDPSRDYVVQIAVMGITAMVW